MNPNGVDRRTPHSRATMEAQKTYLPLLDRLREKAAALPRTRTMGLALIDALVRMNMRWEALQLHKSLEQHPFRLVNVLVKQAISDLDVWRSIAFCDGGVALEEERGVMERRHHDLFQTLWTSFDSSHYLDRIQLFDLRLSTGLTAIFFAGARVIDMGCGHGNFGHAILNAGAAFVLGIDYGEESIRYAKEARDRLGVSADRLRFEVGSVYAVPEPDASFDVAIQNGVFHHLQEEDQAYREMFRLMKPGGWAWIYTEGEGSIARDLFQASAQILSDVPARLVQEHLAHLGFSINKRYHLGDGLKAVYRATSVAELQKRLAGIGFGQFRRLSGGVDTDLDVNDEDAWAKEKFGEGDIRLLAMKMPRDA